MKKIMKKSGTSNAIAIQTKSCELGSRASATPNTATTMRPDRIPPTAPPNTRLVTKLATKAEPIRPADVEKRANIDAAIAGKVKLSLR